MTHSFDGFSMNERRSVRFSFSQCNRSQFRTPTHFEDTRDANRIFAVTHPGKPVASVHPARNPAGKVFLHGGTIALIPRGMPLVMDFTAGTRLYAFHFQAVDILENDLFQDGGQIDPIHGDPGFFSQVEGLLAMPEGIPREMALRHLVEGHVWKWIPHLSSAKPEGRSAEGKFPALFQILSKMPPATVKIRQLATAEGQTGEALSKAFRRAMGIPLKDFLMKRTLGEAQRKLLVTDHPIRAISRDLGFPTEDAFSKFMKAHLGSAPSHWRAQNLAPPFPPGTGA